MRKAVFCSFALVLGMLAAVGVKAQEPSAADKERALQYLEKTKNGVIEATKGLSDAQWNFKPAPDRWSVAEVVEHLAAAEDLLRGLVQEQVMKSPAIAPRDAAEVKKIDDGIFVQAPDRSKKFQAPDALKPTNRFGSPAEAEKHFIDSRATTEAYLKSATELRIHAMDNPIGVKMDGYEWILLIAGHSERHTKQILEVKADPNFPKS